MTLGEAFDAGKLDESADWYESTFGAEWRQLKLEDASARLGASMDGIAEELDELTVQDADDDQELAKLKDKLRITDAIIAKLEQHGGATNDALIAEVLEELYGSAVPPGATDAALEVLSDVDRRRRGEDPEDA